MITIAAVQRVALGGICNSAAAVDLAQVTVAAIRVCQRSMKACQELKPGGESAERVFTAVEVHNILANLINPLDDACATALDCGDGRTVKEMYEEAARAEAGSAE